MRTILVSNITHYHHLASRLASVGFLQRYITTVCPFEDTEIPRWLSRHWRRKMEGRRLNEIPRALTRQVWLAELFQRVLPACHLTSHDRADWVNNHLFDRLAQRYLAECDVLHFVSSVGLYCARAAKRRGATIVCDVRQEHPFFQRRVLEEESARFGTPTKVFGASYEQKVLDEFALADYIVVPSQHARRTYLAEGFPASSLLTLPYGVDLDHFQPSPQAPPSGSIFRVLYAGALTLRKGPQYLLEAFAASRLPNAELILVGPLDPAFRPILARYENICRYLPAMPKLDLARLYASSSVFVLPSLADSFSLATLEAMACGLPVIISENTGAADVVTSGEDGFIVPIRSADHIAAHLSALHSNQERCQQMGRQARETACRLTWERYSQQAVELYRRHFSS